MSHQDKSWHKSKFHCDHCKNGTRSRCKLKNHKKKLYHHFEANVSAVWQMSRQDRAWPDSNCICDYWNTKIAQNASFNNHKKNVIIDLKPIYLLYDKCHIKTEVDMNPSFIVITAKTKLDRDVSLRITRKTPSSIQS